ncbi:DUF1266 domain-containing protein [Acinetobacter sp. ANC 4648]|uniref:DUF1266 domain-containing protein n=1 Tax=Acinetobacter sp. ANC 4648 TaxID=1977875 RepID=UPI000A332879|nr:DUF1266 domain-containing protein [Acinetobacter sp. ANC 4648]OTG82286.1 hypothetical protein B9T27_08550 [Acinetobacter sp. ANC 4648]
MNTNIYLIISGIVCVFIVYMIVLYTIMKKRKQKILNDFKLSNTEKPLTKQQEKRLALGAILFYYRGEKILNFYPNDIDLSQYKYELGQQWDITNAEEAKGILKSLLELQRSSQIDALLQHPSEDLSKIKKQIAKDLKIDLSLVKQTQSTYAWDICRAVSVAKWCFWSGYLSESETWNIIEHAEKIALEYGESWADYTVSFLLGRTIQGYDLEELIVETTQLLHSKNPTLRKIQDIDIYQRYSFV